MTHLLLLVASHKPLPISKNMQQCVLKHFVAKLFEVDRDNNDLHGFYFLILVSAPSTMRLGLQQHSNKTTALAPAYLLHTGEHF